MATKPAWNRIDKATGQITATSDTKAMDAAANAFYRPAEVVDTGRFETPFAIYAISAKITEAEWNYGSIAPPSVGL